MKDMLGREIPDWLHTVFTREVLAEDLWRYGEDELAEAAMKLSEAELEQIQRLALWHYVNATDARMASRAAIEFFEGASRDPKRQRKRSRPEGQRYTAA
jgi:hypothetical protein